MQDIIVTKPYRFVPPHTGRRWPWFIVAFMLDPYLKRNFGLRSHECRNIEKLAQSLDAGHGIIVVGNHSRPCDPMACGWMTRELRHPMYCMASWHLFINSNVDRFLIRRCGAFSIYREGADHASLNFAVDTLVKPDRPLIIFSEGSVTRSNDDVRPMLDGAAMIARMAAKRRAKAEPPGKVVIHPVALKYFFRGDLAATVEPVLQRIEQRLAWQSLSHLPLLDRLRTLGNALLCLRELEYFGAPQATDKSDPGIHERIARLIDHILEPLEFEYSNGDKASLGAYARVQRLRSRILPAIVEGGLSAEEIARRWRQLTDLYIVQQLACYPRNYLGDNPSRERLLETVERLEEDLTDTVTVHRPFDLVFQIGDAIEVPTKRVRGLDEDPLTAATRASISDMIRDICRNPPAE